MSRVLITGGTGFVGSAIARHAKDRGDEVSILDLVAPADQSLHTIQADLTNYQSLREALAGHRFDIVFHVASFPGDTGDAREMMGLNVNGLMNMLDWVKENRPNRLVVTGSICSYGWYPAKDFMKPRYLPVDEEYPVHSKDIKDMYCATKRMQELLALSYHNLYDVPSVVLRMTTVIGPAGKGGGRAWRDFAKGMKEEKKAQVQMFSREEKYHFVDIRDVVRAHFVAGEHPKAVGEVFNVAAKEATTGADFESAMEKVAPEVELEFGYPWSMCQGHQLWFDTSKARDLIGFEAQYSLEDSVRSIKEWIDTGGLEEDRGGQFDEKYGKGVKKDQ